MADQLYVLNEGDLSVLRGLIAREKRDKTRPPYVGTLAPPSLAPEVYIALTPKNGIPAISGEPGTGSHVLHAESGTGTGFRDYAGQNLCKLYQISPSDTDPEIVPLGISVYVNNLSNSAISGGIFIPIMRDKSGSWLAVPLALAPAVSSSSTTSADYIIAASSSHNYTVAAAASKIIDWASIGVATPTNWSIANDFAFGANTSIKFALAGSAAVLGIGVTVAINAQVTAFTTGGIRLIINYEDSVGTPTWTNIAGDFARVDSAIPYVYLSAYGEIVHTAGGNAAFYAAITNFTTGNIILDSDDTSGTPPAPGITRYGIRAFAKVIA